MYVMECIYEQLIDDIHCIHNKIYIYLFGGLPIYNRPRACIRIAYNLKFESLAHDS